MAPLSMRGVRSPRPPQTGGARSLGNTVTMDSARAVGTRPVAAPDEESGRGSWRYEPRRAGSRRAGRGSFRRVRVIALIPVKPAVVSTPPDWDQFENARRRIGQSFRPTSRRGGRSRVELDTPWTPHRQSSMFWTRPTRDWPEIGALPLSYGTSRRRRDSNPQPPRLKRWTPTGSRTCFKKAQRVRPALRWSGQDQPGEGSSRAGKNSTAARISLLAKC